MKKIFCLSAVVTLLTFLSINNAYAAYSANGYIDKYDSATGLYYKSIKDYKRVEKEEKGFLSSIKSLKSGSYNKIINISIYNPKTDKIVYVFKDDKVRNISKIFFADSYNQETNSIDFVGSFAGVLKNNNDLRHRKMTNKMILSEINTEKNTETIWMVNKDGSSLNAVTTINRNTTSWHVDVKRSVIRLVSVEKGKMSIKNFDWK